MFSAFRLAFTIGLSTLGLNHLPSQSGPADLWEISKKQTNSVILLVTSTHMYTNTFTTHSHTRIK